MDVPVINVANRKHSETTVQTLARSTHREASNEVQILLTIVYFTVRANSAYPYGADSHQKTLHGQ